MTAARVSAGRPDERPARAHRVVVPSAVPCSAGRRAAHRPRAVPRRARRQPAAAGRADGAGVGAAPAQRARRVPRVARGPRDGDDGRRTPGEVRRGVSAGGGGGRERRVRRSVRGEAEGVRADGTVRAHGPAGGRGAAGLRGEEGVGGGGGPFKKDTGMITKS